MATSRREFLVNVGVGAVGLLTPGVVLGGDRPRELVFSQWDGDGPWPGLRVWCLHSEGEFKRHQIGSVYYLEHGRGGDWVVRLCFGLELYDMIERGVHIPQISVDDCRPEFRENIRDDMMKAYILTCTEADKAGMSGVDRERMCNFPVLLRHRVSVQVGGPGDLLEKHGAEIPSGWKRVPSRSKVLVNHLADWTFSHA